MATERGEGQRAGRKVGSGARRRRRRRKQSRQQPSLQLKAWGARVTPEVGTGEESHRVGRVRRRGWGLSQRQHPSGRRDWGAGVFPL